ncbi:CBS domain-containing protein [uncultured Acetobacterium sp.]|jgi:predicted transcriptional regulator|uniref:CBS domain-containing protein n=1 Tax=uncultured Acetobacterium sp. TaxID=217139 RepID=UPI0024240FAF|nr:CBS domain-containing protein [uncultured Acetobacterium sp.]MBU4542153.1 CBS domain-containing protein [Bacillota bacterium]
MKNHLFYLLPKSETVFLTNTDSFNQAYNMFVITNYTALPVINKKGQYVGTICEGDLLRVLSLSLTHPEIDLDSIEIKDIDFKINLEVARVNESYEHLVELAVKQNFIPLVDDQGIFIGILRRQELIKELIKFLSEKVAEQDVG